MAEKKGFFRRIFSFANAPEDERVPEHGEAPRPSDEEMVRTPGAPDPDLHQPALADAGTDTEAGAQPEDGGGITPLKEAAAKAPHASNDSPAEEAPGTAEKKTPQ
ncbi:hypothetical protein [Mangrovibrevibacter kandeliae]|uniref:hypothetical protein n=1 Tax=Mangrovibrevibacter kandeliae TaxID=2968473 RepID=UPI0021174B46|nr:MULTISPECIES: hypothetical protein [unclassified Aurantimonas]MCQ8783677.1 hypothetical protein [Aurantimonas sp. CSK15Z-1]MCW4116361.1 hypothetical protein [Aurantimonas sp. MSK8Z-1]